MADKQDHEDNAGGFVNPSQTSGLSIDRPKPRIDVGGGEHYKNQEVMNSLNMNNPSSMPFGNNNAFLPSQSGNDFNQFAFKSGASIDRPLPDTQTFGVSAAFNGES